MHFMRQTKIMKIFVYVIVFIALKVTKIVVKMKKQLNGTNDVQNMVVGSKKFISVTTWSETHIID